MVNGLLCQGWSHIPQSHQVANVSHDDPFGFLVLRWLYRVSKGMTKLLGIIITHPHCKWSRNSELLSHNRSAVQLMSLYACVYILPTTALSKNKVLKIILCSQLTSRCEWVSKIHCRNFNSHEWLFHLNTAGGDNVCLVIQTKSHSCRGGYKGALNDFFMEWYAKNDPTSWNIAVVRYDIISVTAQLSVSKK